MRGHRPKDPRTPSRFLMAFLGEQLHVQPSEFARMTRQDIRASVAYVSEAAEIRREAAEREARKMKSKGRA